MRLCKFDYFVLCIHVWIINENAWLRYQCGINRHNNSPTVELFLSSKEHSEIDCKLLNIFRYKYCKNYFKIDPVFIVNMLKIKDPHLK